MHQEAISLQAHLAESVSIIPSTTSFRGLNCLSSLIVSCVIIQSTIGMDVWSCNIYHYDFKRQSLSFSSIDSQHSLLSFVAIGAIVESLAVS